MEAVARLPAAVFRESGRQMTSTTLRVIPDTMELGFAEYESLSDPGYVDLKGRFDNGVVSHLEKIRFVG